MSKTLRQKIIRLAHKDPSLRPYLLPLLDEGFTVSASRREIGYTVRDAEEYIKFLQEQREFYSDDPMAVRDLDGAIGEMEKVMGKASAEIQRVQKRLMRDYSP